MDLAGRIGVAFLLLTHLSKDGEALGRRIVGACRTAWKLSTPDPEGQADRRRLWVDKTYDVKPPPLGMTIGGQGCSFDFDPPTKPEPEARRPGPPSAKVKAATDWLADRLAPNPARVSDLRKEAAKAGIIPSDSFAQTLYRARDELRVEEFEADGRKWWKLPLVRDVQEANSDNSDDSDNLVRDPAPL